MPWDAVGPLGGDVAIPRLVAWLTDGDRWRRFAQISIAGEPHDEDLRQRLVDAGIPKRLVHILTAAQFPDSCAMAYAAIQEGSLTHSAGQSLLDESVAGSDRVESKSGAWRWSSDPHGKKVHVEAMCVAYWTARTTRRVPGRRAVVSY